MPYRGLSQEEANELGQAIRKMVEFSFNQATKCKKQFFNTTSSSGSIRRTSILSAALLIYQNPSLSPIPLTAFLAAFLAADNPATAILLSGSVVAYSQSMAEGLKSFATLLCANFVIYAVSDTVKNPPNILKTIKQRIWGEETALKTKDMAPS